MSPPTAALLDPPDLDDERADDALLQLLKALEAAGYRFVTPTPATHARVLARPGRRRAENLQDVLGWSLPFAPDLISRELMDLLVAAEACAPAEDGLWRARFRVSSLQDTLFLHSAYPTDEEDSVFFGPDSYRFADLIRAQLADSPTRAGLRVADIGAGAGVGAIVCAKACPGAQVTAIDINPKALRLARINARAAGVELRTLLAGDLGPLDGSIDLAVANPPYLIDASSRTYRHGGGAHGEEVSIEMAREAAERLSPGGRLILYSGSAIVSGRDPLREALAAMAPGLGCSLTYREIDPDVFGEELDKPPYQDVDRIAVVAAVFRKA